MKTLLARIPWWTLGALILYALILAWCLGGWSALSAAYEPPRVLQPAVGQTPLDPPPPPPPTAAGCSDRHEGPALILDGGRHRDQFLYQEPNPPWATLNCDSRQIVQGMLQFQADTAGHCFHLLDPDGQRLASACP